jgi:4'-phosphopantetheinyl transferase
VLARYVETAPDAIEIWAERHHKPRLSSFNPRDVRFNLAHRDGRALIAIARGFEVGVDLEAARRLEESAAVAATVLSPTELTAMETLPAPERHAAILRLWVRREALLKGTGTGLRVPPAHIDVGPPDPAVRRPVAVAGASWTLWDLTPWPDAVGAVTCSGTGRMLRRFSEAR